MITTLTETQEKLLNAYRQKWRSLSLSTQRIDQTKATEAIHALYQLAQQPQPKILFCASPASAIRSLLVHQGKIIKRQLKQRFSADQYPEMMITLCQILHNILWPQFCGATRQDIWEQLWLSIAHQILPETELIQRLFRSKFGDDPINPDLQEKFCQRMIQDKFSLSYYLLFPDISGVGDCLWTQLCTALDNHLTNFLWNQISSQLLSEIKDELETKLWQAIKAKTGTTLSPSWTKQKRLEFELGVLADMQENLDCSVSWGGGVSYLRPELWEHDGAVIDFCISVLNCDYDPVLWSIFKALKEHCGFIFPQQDICLVCDRPIKLSLDSDEQLHAQAEPALQFRDGYSIYANHGTILPEKYGKVLPQNWSLDSLEQESDPDVKQALMLVYSSYAQSQKLVDLTAEQELQIPQYIEKWDRLALATEPIDKQQATKVIQAIYKYHNRAEPNILFCQSPHEAWQTNLFQSQRQCPSWVDIVTILEEQVKKQLTESLRAKVRKKFARRFRRLAENISDKILRKLDQEFNQNSFGWRRWAGDDRLLYVHNHPNLWAVEGAYLDFCISVLGCNYDPFTWPLFKGFVTHCGWTYVYENTCIVCDRPEQILIHSSEKNDPHRKVEFKNTELEIIIKFRDFWSC